MLRSTRNLIKRVRISQEPIILLLGSALDSSLVEAWLLASKPNRAAKQLLLWCPWVKEEQAPCFSLGAKLYRVQEHDGNALRVKLLIHGWVGHSCAQRSKQTCLEWGDQDKAGSLFNFFPEKLRLQSNGIRCSLHVYKSRHIQAVQ